jgi:hypothetical protein
MSMNNQGDQEAPLSGDQQTNQSRSEDRGAASNLQIEEVDVALADQSDRYIQSLYFYLIKLFHSFI